MVLITGQASVSLAVESIQQGAYDFVEKPVRAPRHRSSCSTGPLETAAALREDASACAAARAPPPRRRLSWATAPAMRSVLELVQTSVAPPGRPRCVIQGESGTGKELVARAVHRALGAPGRALRGGELRGASPGRSSRAELFGHEQGRLHRRPASGAPGCSALAERRARSSSTRSASSPLDAAGQAAAGRSRSGEIRRARAARADVAGRRAGRRRHPPGPRGSWSERGRVPRGPLLPARRRARSSVPPLRDRAATTSRCWRAHFAASAARRSARQAGLRLDAGRAAAAQALRLARATSASSGTRWSGPSSWLRRAQHPRPGTCRPAWGRRADAGAARDRRWAGRSTRWSGEYLHRHPAAPRRQPGADRRRRSA